MQFPRNLMLPPYERRCPPCPTSSVGDTRPDAGALLLRRAVKVDVCVPPKSVTDTVAFLTPVVWAVCGLNCTVTMQAAPGARVVWPIN